jgi:hypothetical protein
MLTALVAIASALHRHADLFGPVRASPLPEALHRQVSA